MDGFDGVCSGDTIPLEQIHSTEPPHVTEDKVNSSVEIKDGSPTKEVHVNPDICQPSNCSPSSNQSSSNNYNERSTIETENKTYYGLKPSQSATFDSQKANKYRKYAIIVSWISILTTLAICILEFIVSYTENSTAAFGLAFSAVLDLMSSAVVLWRYYKSYDTFSMHRENVACVVLGVLFLLSSISIGVKAIYNLNLGETPNYTEGGLGILVVTSIVSSVLCFFLLVFKFILSRKLASRTLLTDALNSLAAAIIALSIVISSEVTEHSPHMWYLDSTIGLVVSLMLLVYGCWLLLNHAPELQKH